MCEGGGGSRRCGLEKRMVKQVAIVGTRDIVRLKEAGWV